MSEGSVLTVDRETHRDRPRRPRPVVAAPVRPLVTDLELAGVTTGDDLRQALVRRRRRAAAGTGRAIVGLDTIARRSGLPRSTVHSYLSGLRLPPADALDRIVVCLGADTGEQRAWAEALQRVADRAPVPADEPGPTLVGRGPVRAPRELPRPPRGFVGRTDELRRLDAHTGDSEPGPVVRVTGPAGIGKTAVVLTWAHAAVDRFPDGQLWLDLHGFGPRPPVDPADAVVRMLHTLGVPTADLPPDLDGRSAALRSALAGRRLLVVLDDARDSAQVRPLLAGTPGVVTLVTSRSELRSLGLTEGAARVTLRPVPLDEGVAMLQPTPSADAGLPSHPVDLVRDLTRCCAGLPLALRLLRERLATTSTARLRHLVDSLDAEAVSDRLAVLEVVDGEGGHGVRAALGWSYGALATEAAALLRRLPLTRTTHVDVETAAALLGDDLVAAGRAVDTLVGASLLEPRGGGRFVVHDLTAAFARSRQADDPPGEIEAARRRLGSHLVAVTAAAAHLLRPVAGHRPPGLAPGGRWPFDDARGAFAWLAAERSALTAVVADLVDHDRADAAFAVAEAVVRGLLTRCRPEDLEPLLGVAERAAVVGGDPARDVVVHRYRGIAAAHHGDLARATDCFRLALSAAERGTGRRRLAKERGNLGYLLLLTGHLSEARAMQVQATADTDDPCPKLPGLVTLARLERCAGDLPAAGRWLARAWVERGSGPDRVDDANLLQVAAVVARDAGDLRRHDALLGRLEAVARCDGSAHLAAVVDVLRAERELVGDGPDAAAAAVAAARAALARPVALVQVDWTVRAHLALAAGLGRRDPVAGLAAAHVAAGLAADHGLRLHHGLAVLTSAQLAAAAGDLPGARRDGLAARRLALVTGHVPTLVAAADLLASLPTAGELTRGPAG